MAVHFDQNYGSGHTCIFRFGAAPTAPPFTLDCWFNSEPFSITKRLVVLGPASGSDHFSLTLYGGANSGRVAGVIADFVFTDSAETTDTFEFGTWHHALITVSATHITPYLDGVAGTPVPWTLTPDNISFIIIGGAGTSQASTFGLQGCMEKVGVWNRVLDAGEIASRAGGAAASTIPSGLIADLELLDEATATHDNVSGTEYSLFEAVGSAGISTCPDSPEDPDPIETPDEDECGFEDEADELAAAITWPQCDLVPGSISVDLISPTVSPGRSFTCIEKVVQPDAGHWRIVFNDIPVKTKANTLLWREIESLLNGRNGVILVPVYAAKLSDTPIAATVGGAFEIGQTTIGLLQTAGETIRAGMDFSIGEWLYRIKRIGETEDSVTEVIIWPPLRADVADDEACDFNTPRLRCRLATDNAMDLNLGLLRYGNPSVEFREDV